MIQTDLFEARIQPLFEQHREDWLTSARTVAEQMCVRNGTATTDDIWAHCPPPSDVDPRVLGAVFKTSQFEATGIYRKSGRSTSHHRPIQVFRLARTRRAA